MSDVAFTDQARPDQPSVTQVSRQLADAADAGPILYRALRHGYRLRDAMDARGLRAADLARRLNSDGVVVSAARISQLRNQGRQSVRVDLAEGIEAALGVPRGQVFEDVESRWGEGRKDRDVTTRRPPSAAWETALRLAGGDARRCEVRDDGTVIVRNTPR